jgi:cobalt/nickel transport system permease protein
VLISASLALAELRISGVQIPATLLGISLLLFLVSAALEGAITLVVVQGLETVQPGFVQQSGPPRAIGLAMVGTAAVLLAVVGILFASTHPDGLEKLAGELGVAARAKALFGTPFADYQASFAGSIWLRKAAAGLCGLALIYGACLAMGRAVRKRS